MDIDDRAVRYVGDDWQFEVYLKTSDGSAFNLNGYTPIGKLFQSGPQGVDADLTLGNERIEIVGVRADGRVRLHIERELTERVRAELDGSLATTPRVVLELFDPAGLLQLVRIIPILPLSKRLTSVLQLPSSIEVVVGQQGPAGANGLVHSVNGKVESDPVLGAHDVGAFTQAEVTSAIATGVATRQPVDATLTALSAVSTLADRLVYASGVDAFSTTTLTPFARAILDDADAATVRTTIGAEAEANKAQANGYAGLDGTGKVPTAQLPASVLGAISYQGAWNATTNSPAIPAAASGNKGWYYKVSVDGTTAISGISDWQIGDWIISNGAAWDKIDNTDQVVSVAGLAGTITSAALKSALAVVLADISDASANGRSLLAAASYAAMKTLLALANVDNTSDATKNAAAVTLTNKTISGAANTLTNIDLATSVTGKLPLASLPILQVLQGCTKGQIGANSYAYLGTNGSDIAPYDVGFTINRAGTLTVDVATDATPGPGQTYTYEIYKNNAPTGITATQVNGSFSASLGAVSVNPLDMVAVGIITGSTANPARIRMKGEVT